MTSFAYYRLPYANTYSRLIQHHGEPLRLRSYAELDDRQGFVFAPFSITDDCPLLLLQPDEEQHGLSIHSSLSASLSADRAVSAIQQPTAPSQKYHIDFLNFHSRLLTGEFRKLVLARSTDSPLDESFSAERLFMRACAMYPRGFVALVSTPQSGTWLMATPEVLLQGDGHQWMTMALAGTMPYTSKSGWSDKNIQEQRYVATYITQTLEQFATNICEEGPDTARAGQLVHLRSLFHFTLPDADHLGTLVQALHPTPAVCGLPKREAWQFILANENAPRRYYSGFAGPLAPHGDTRLFVTLRCMQLFAGHCRLYAGGGLLRDSREQQEWEETEAKLQTMKALYEM